MSRPCGRTPKTSRPATGEAGEAFPSSSALQRTLKARIGGVDPTSYEGRSRSAGDFSMNFPGCFSGVPIMGYLQTPKTKGNITPYKTSTTMGFLHCSTGGKGYDETNKFLRFASRDIGFFLGEKDLCGIKTI